MTPTGTADVELVVANFLDAALDVSVGLKHPTSKASPWILVTQLDGSPEDSTDHLSDYLIQFDCYAGTDNSRATASAAMRRTRVTLKDLKGTVREGVTFGRVKVVSCPRIPDDTVSDPPRERYSLTMSIFAHA